MIFFHSFGDNLRKMTDSEIIPRKTTITYFVDSCSNTLKETKTFETIFSTAFNRFIHCL